MQKQTLTTWVEISKANLLYNVQQFRDILLSDMQIMGVVKSNAYGHGIENTAKVLSEAVDYFAVVSVEEALLLRSIGIEKPILVLSIIGFDDDLISTAIKNNIELSIFDSVSFFKIAELAKKANKKAKVHLKIDTGMSRLGFSVEQSSEMIKKIVEHLDLKLQGVFSHLACADTDVGISSLQIDAFNKILKYIKDNDVSVPIQHLSLTAGVMTKSIAGNAVRIGLGLYGLYPSALCREMVKKDNKGFNLKPVLSWHTKIIQVKEIDGQSGVGYSHTYITKERIKIGVLPVGYWDGLGRKLSNNGEVLIQGKRCKIIGRVCMNHTMVDLSSLQDVKPGQKVTILGKVGEQEITANELTKQIGTINYGIVTRINPLIPRVIV